MIETSLIFKKFKDIMMLFDQGEKEQILFNDKPNKQLTY